MAGTPPRTCSQSAVPGSFEYCYPVTSVQRLQSGLGSCHKVSVLDIDDWKIKTAHYYT
ncbi:hypothetical protein GBAR_LOCUS26859, partial [Geodia barretti]